MHENAKAESDVFGPKIAFRTEVSYYDVVESLLTFIMRFKTPPLRYILVLRYLPKHACGSVGLVSFEENRLNCYTYTV